MSVILEQAIAEEQSASADRAGSRGRSDPLGATTLPGGVNFSVFPRHATGVELVPFDREDDPRPARVLPLDPAENRTYHYWHLFVLGVPPGQLYGYRVHGPFDLGRGLRFDPAMGDEVRRTSKGTTTPWELLDFELPPAGDRGPEGWHRWIDTSLDSPQEDACAMRLRSAGCSPGGRAFPGGQQEVGHAELNDYAKIVTALFVIANPVGVIPTFISLTGGYSMADKRHTSRVTAATVFIVLVAAAVSGEHLLHFFGISLDFKALLALALRPLAAGASVHASSDFPESSIR